MFDCASVGRCDVDNLGESSGLFVEAGAEAAVFDPVLFEGVTGGVEAGFGAVEVDLAVVAHPDFADRGDGD